MNSEADVLRGHLKQSRIPDYMHEGLVRFLTEGLPTGGFLIAVLSNDLIGACHKADDVNKYLLYDYIFFLFNHAPGNTWGSSEKVQAWFQLNKEKRLGIQTE